MRVNTAWLLGNFVGFTLWGEFSLPSCVLLSLTVSFFLFFGVGIYSTLFFLTMWTVGKQGRDSLKSPVIIGIIALYILSFIPTILFTVTSYYSLIASVGDGAHYLGGRPGLIIVAINGFVMVISTIIADLTLAWRVYVIYLRNIRVLAGVLAILLAMIVCCVGTLTLDVLLVVHGLTPLYLLLNFRFGVAMIICALIFNWVVTGLIVARLWWADKRMKNTSFLSHYDGAGTTPVTGTYQKVIVALIESGVLYGLVLLLFLITYMLGKSGQNIPIFLVPIVPRVIGIVPTLIVLQRSLGYIQTSETPAAPTSKVEFAVFPTRSCSPTMVPSHQSSNTFASNNSGPATVQRDVRWVENTSLAAVED